LLAASLITRALCLPHRGARCSVTSAAEKDERKRHHCPKRRIFDWVVAICRAKLPSRAINAGFSRTGRHARAVPRIIGRTRDRPLSDARRQRRCRRVDIDARLKEIGRQAGVYEPGARPRHRGAASFRDRRSRAIQKRLRPFGIRPSTSRWCDGHRRGTP
jgi:hypothetical protein